MSVLESHFNDIIHGAVVLAIVVAATLYAVLEHYNSDNIWAVYSAGIAYAAGRSGTNIVRSYRAGDANE